MVRWVDLTLFQSFRTSNNLLAMSCPLSQKMDHVLVHCEMIWLHCCAVNWIELKIKTDVKRSGEKNWKGQISAADILNGLQVIPPGPLWLCQSGWHGWAFSLHFSHTTRSLYVYEISGHDGGGFELSWCLGCFVEELWILRRIANCGTLSQTTLKIRWIVLTVRTLMNPVHNCSAHMLHCRDGVCQFALKSLWSNC